MTTILIVYGSSTGNTGKLTLHLANVFREANFEVTAKPAAACNVEAMTDYDVILLGSSTWGNGSLQDNMKQFYFKMDSVELAGKRAAAFGPGDAKSYPRSFCKAVDMLENKLVSRGAEIIVPGLKIDGDADSFKNVIVEWAEKIISFIK